MRIITKIFLILLVAFIPFYILDKVEENYWESKLENIRDTRVKIYALVYKELRRSVLESYRYSNEEKKSLDEEFKKDVKNVGIEPGYKFKNKSKWIKDNLLNNKK